MTVSTPLNKIIYSGNGATTVFPFTFATPAVASDIQVFFTDINGNVTLLAANTYTLIFNPVTGTNPTPVGGSVTYNPGGVPIPTGTFLTIFRNLPLTQGTSLANQGTSYQQVTEQALDYLMMVNQQVLEIQSRALVVSVSDPAPNPLPAVAARAGFVLGFDVNGNPIAVSTLPAGTVSSAMAPVVSAASLAAGRTAFGLGNAAVEAIGLGLQDNGAGSLQTFFGEVSDSLNQTVTAAFHQNIRSATGALTYTLPLTTTLFNGFGFWVYAQTAAITFAINVADAFNGAGTGASLTVPPGSKVFVSTNAAGTWYIRGMANPGFNAPLNLQINATVASSALTIVLKDQNGNDPSPASPVIFTVSSSGNNVPRAVTTPLSITIPSGATIGTANGVNARLWIGLFDNAGTPVLGVYNCLHYGSPNFTLVPWDETSAQTTTGISAGATLDQTWYTNGALTSRSFRIIGYIEIVEATAGTWSSGPTKVQLFGPGAKKPGDNVQGPSMVSSATTTTLPITPFSAANLIFIQAWATVTTGTAVTIHITRGGVNIGQGQSASAAAALGLLDLPNSASAITYGLAVAAGTLSTETFVGTEVMV